MDENAGKGRGNTERTEKIKKIYCRVYPCRCHNQTKQKKQQQINSAKNKKRKILREFETNSKTNGERQDGESSNRKWKENQRNAHSCGQLSSRLLLLFMSVHTATHHLLLHRAADAHRVEDEAGVLRRHRRVRIVPRLPPLQVLRLAPPLG